MSDQNDLEQFRETVYAHYQVAQRTFPWRENLDPWGILVSEFMLQQTQTQRVIPYWIHWMTVWATPETLHKATLEDALKTWSGLGYNRRCRYLKECAAIITNDYSGKVPQTPEILRSLPGVGTYTASAVSCFAYNHPSVFIETNIRSAIIHFFFKQEEKVTDSEIVPILSALLEKERNNSRQWYWALMDYGVALKKATKNPSRKSARYTKQSRFEGSFRQRRGIALKALLSQGPAHIAELHNRTGIKTEDLYEALKSLEKESLVSEKSGMYMVKEVHNSEI